MKYAPKLILRDRAPTNNHRAQGTIETIAEIVETVENAEETETGTTTVIAVTGDAQDLPITDLTVATTKQTPIPQVETTELESEKTDMARDEMIVNGIGETGIHVAATTRGRREEIVISLTTDEAAALLVEVVAVVEAETVEIVAIEVVTGVDEKIVMNLLLRLVDQKTALHQRRENPHPTLPILSPYRIARGD